MVQYTGAKGKRQGTLVAIDLHKTSFTWCAVNAATGDELEVGKMATKNRKRIVALMEKWPKPLTVGVESVGFFHWFVELIRPYADEVLLGDPTRLRRLADRNVKTDFRDARTGAGALFRGDYPEAFLLQGDLYTLRQAARHRNDLSRRCAKAKSSLRRISLRANLPGPKTLDGSRAVGYSTAYGDRLNPMDTYRWSDLTDQLILLERQLARADRELETRIKAITEIQDSIRRLDTAPGVGLIVAATVYLETGGLVRFDHPDPLIAYAGMAPRTFASGDTVRHGRISKAGPPSLRWVLQQAAWVAIRTHPGIRKLHGEISRRAGSKKAAVAVARKILIWLWAMERTQSDWNDDLHPVHHKACSKCPVVKTAAARKR